MKQIKRGLVYTLVGSMLIGNISPALAYTYKDSVADVEYTDVTENGTNNTTVYAEVGSAFKVVIPKHIILDGTTKSGAYTVSVEGDIAGTETVNVMPDEAFFLKSNNLKDVVATIDQDKIQWKYDEMLEGSSIIGNGAIDASGITAGSWNGNFNFNINLKNNFIEVQAKDQNDVDLSATATLIEGQEKETLLNSLVETGLVNSKEDVAALIEVESNDFDGLADTTFDVSNIAQEGDKVTILHFDETIQEWEYISTETVDVNGKISADFSSYSPVVFVKVNSNETYDKIELAPGLYDVDNNLVCTWEDSGIDIINGCNAANYDSKKTSAYYVLKNYYPNVTILVLPENIDTIGRYAFYKCKNITDIIIPDGVTTIKNDVFHWCKGLKNIVIPKSVTYIGNTSFSMCTSLENVYYAGTKEEWNSIYFGSAGNVTLKRVNIIYNYTE